MAIATVVLQLGHMTLISYIKDNSQPMFTQLLSNSRRGRVCRSRDFIANFDLIANFKLHCVFETSLLISATMVIINLN